MTPKKIICASGEYNLLIRADKTSIMPDQSMGSATISVDTLGNNFVWVNVQGADLDKAMDSSGTSLLVSDRKVKITKSGDITFQLRNLAPGMQFTIQAEGFKSSKSTGKKEIQFAVSNAMEEEGSGEYNL